MLKVKDFINYQLKYLDNFKQVFTYLVKFEMAVKKYSFKFVTVEVLVSSYSSNDPLHVHIPKCR